LLNNQNFKLTTVFSKETIHVWRKWSIGEFVCTLSEVEIMESGARLTNWVWSKDLDKEHIWTLSKTVKSYDDSISDKLNEYSVYRQEGKISWAVRSESLMPIKEYVLMTRVLAKHLKIDSF